MEASYTSWRNIIGPDVDPKLGTRVTLPNGHIYFPLLPGSPAINAGDAAILDEETFNSRDAAGNPRVFGENVDIGACEYVPPLKIRADIEQLQRGCSTLLTAEYPDEDEEYFIHWDLDGDSVYERFGRTVLFDSSTYFPEVDGRRIVKAVVRDAKGRQAVPVEYGITMTSSVPSLVVKSPTEILERRGTDWEFETVADSGLATMDWRIDWGDSTESTHLPGGPRNRVVLRHRYAVAGNYGITVTTTNILGETNTFRLPVRVDGGVRLNTAAAEESAPEPIVVPMLAQIAPQSSADLVTLPQTALVREVYLRRAFSSATTARIWDEAIVHETGGIEGRLF